MDALFGPNLLQRIGALVLGASAAPETEPERQARLRQEAQAALAAKSQRGVLLEDLERATQALQHYLATCQAQAGSSTARLSKRDQQLLLERDESKESHASLLMQSTDEPPRVLLTDDVAAATRLCAVLERCLSHGLRLVESEGSETVKFFGAVKWTCSRVDAVRRSQQLAAMQRVADPRSVVTASVAGLPRALRGFVAAVRAAASLPHVPSDEGKARAFLRQALNTHVLHASLSMVLSEGNADLLASYYTADALCRQRDDVQVLLQLLQPLDLLAFAFGLDDPRLDADPEELPFATPRPPLLARKPTKRAAKLIDPEDMVNGRVRLCAVDEAATLVAEKLVLHQQLRPAFDTLRGGNPLSETLAKAAQSQRLDDAAMAVLRFLELGYPEYDVFGAELLTVLCNPFLTGLARFDPSLGVPDVADACLVYLLEAVDSPGLLQVHLAADHVLELRDSIEDLGGFHKHMSVEVHEVTAILLQYLWELPDPLLTAERLANFLACVQSDSGMDAAEQRMLLRVLVNDLPWSCKPLLARLCHVVGVALAPAHAQRNGLTVFAAASCLAPLLLRPLRDHRVDEYEDAWARKYPVGAHGGAGVGTRYRVLPADREGRRGQQQAARQLQDAALVLQRLFLDHEEILRDVREDLAARRARLCEKVAWMELLRVEVEERIDLRQPRHAQLLQRLWAGLLPAEEDAVVDTADVHAVLRSRRWRASGFHTEDPLGGFRGGGVLSLECLVHFLEEYPEKASAMMQRNAAPGGDRYPFPVASINVLRMLLALLMLDEAPARASQLVLHSGGGAEEKPLVVKLQVAERVSRAPFWPLLDGGKQTFLQLHAMAFLLLDLHWLHAGATQMGFQPVLDATRRQLGWLLEQAPQSVDEMWAAWMRVREQHATKFTPLYAAAEREALALAGQQKPRQPQDDRLHQQDSTTDEAAEGVGGKELLESRAATGDEEGTVVADRAVAY